MSDYDKIAFELDASQHTKVNIETIDSLICLILNKNYDNIYSHQASLYCDLGAEYIILYCSTRSIKRSLCLNIYYAYNQVSSHYYYSKLMPTLYSLKECDNLTIYYADNLLSSQNDLIYMPDGAYYSICKLFSGEFSI